MDGGFVGYPPHLPAQGVEFLDELALGEAADRGVAGHQRNGVEVDVEQERLTTHPRRREGRFAARMAPPDDDDVIFPVHAKKGDRFIFSTFLGLPGPRNSTRLSIFFSISSTNRGLPVNCPRWSDLRISSHSSAAMVSFTHAA